jgi:hypothetical protein
MAGLRQWWVLLPMACLVLILVLYGSCVGELLVHVSGLEGEAIGHYHTAQAAATLALKRFYHEGALETKFSTTNSVLAHGFPLSWKDCTLRRLWDREAALSEPLQIVVLGGSSSAHAAKNCKSGPHSTTNDSQSSARRGSDLYAGRYSNILMEQLFREFFSMDQEDGHSLEFNVINAAHGATDTLWNALMLDELVHTNNKSNRTFDSGHSNHDAKRIRGADLLIVEFGINDALGGSTKLPQRTNHHLAQMMNLWLWRVYQYFGEHQDPPPILFVYLWDATFYYLNPTSLRLEVNTDHLLRQGIGQTSWNAQKQVLEHYQSLGWSIGVANVGAVINSTSVAHDPGVILDDKHHPNCATMHLISAMIQHAIYVDLAHCPGHRDDDDQTTAISQIRPKKLEPNATTTTTTTSSAAAELLETLMDDNIKVGSIMQWEPNVGSTLLQLGWDSDFFNVSEHGYVQADFGTKSYPWRADRKKSFTLPSCAEQQHVHFSVLEPQLQWIGIGYHIFPDPGKDIVIVIDMTINNMSIHLTDNDKLRGRNRTILEFDVAGIVKEWIRVSDYVSQQPNAAMQYSLSFCYKQLFDGESMDPTFALTEECPFGNAYSINVVCEIWEADNFDAFQSCPYGHLHSVTEACFEWREAKLDELASLEAFGDLQETPQEFLPPQLNWVVGVGHS